ncbi:hypothetical protein PORY_002855 [Pneumocystis oryctolagi]|uniref:Uncharacterized protein n=1 Tax=Pneumocystis oryctolagi TaxID=42067 RepID=A0ACB7C9N0_9ASCO|nr:hypothetical protein PORY_002855 [Pneumocystis oryctolagi]
MIFDMIFDKFDPNKTGKVSIRDFVNFMDELEKVQPYHLEPIFDDISRKQAEKFISQNQDVEVNKNDLLTFIESLTGKDISSITQEPLVSKETTLDTGFLSSRPRSAALDVQTLQHQKPRQNG